MHTERVEYWSDKLFKDSETIPLEIKQKVLRAFLEQYVHLNEEEITAFLQPEKPREHEGMIVEKDLPFVMAERKIYDWFHREKPQMNIWQRAAFLRALKDALHGFYTGEEINEMVSLMASQDDDPLIVQYVVGSHSYLWRRVRNAFLTPEDEDDE